MHKQESLCYFPAVVDYHRNLPHWFPEGRSIFLTWRLYGSLPAKFLLELRGRHGRTAREEFKKTEEKLDRADFGPLWLKDPRIAACVVEKLSEGAERLHYYDLHAYVVMANHVHMLMTPQVEVRRLMNGLKGVTARSANAILNRTGKRFWQDESFDHWVRSEAQFARIRNYIEMNPVTAGLVNKPEDWPWSSAFRPASK